MLRICACTCMCMVLPDIGKNHSELSQNEIWVVSPRDYLIFLLNSVGVVQRMSEVRISCLQNLSLGKKHCVGLGPSFLMINFRDNEPLSLHPPSSFSDPRQEGETTCFCTSDIWLFYLEIGIHEPGDV